MSFAVTDSVKQAPPSMNGVIPSLRTTPSGMLGGGSNGYVQHGMPPSAMLDSSRDSFAQPNSLPNGKPPPLSVPPSAPTCPPRRCQAGRFSDDAGGMQRSQPPPPPGDWSPVNSQPRGYNGLPTPSFLGMEEPAMQHSQQPPPPPSQQAPQHVYPTAYGHFDSSYPTPPSSVPSMRPEPDRGFMPYPNLYSNMDHQQGEHYGLLDPNGQSFDARSGMPRSAYHPGAPVLRPDQRAMPFGNDARYMGPQPVRKAIPDPPFFEGASSMVPALPVAQKRPKARIDSAARKRICQFAEVNPEMRQADVAAAFNVERSTVSKILKQKAKWLAYQADDASDEAKPAPNAALKGARITKGPIPAAPVRRQSSTTARSRAPSVLPSPQANARSPLPGMPTPDLGMPRTNQTVPSGLPFLPRPSQYPP